MEQEYCKKFVMKGILDDSPDILYGTIITESEKIYMDKGQPKSLIGSMLI